MKKFLYLLLLLPLLLTGCSSYSYEEVDNRLTGIDLSQLVFTAHAGSKTITVPNSNDPITASSNFPWCTATVSGSSVTVSVAVNDEFPNRTAMLTITCGTKKAVVPVTQYGNRFAMSVLNLAAGYVAATYKVGVQSMAPYTAVSNTPWITIDIAADTILVHVPENPFPSPARTGTISVSSGIITQTLTVTQAKGLLVYDYDVFIGTYTMHYATAINTFPPNRTRSATVTIEEKVYGESYYLKGILPVADDAICGGITVLYKEEVKGIEILGQILFQRPGAPAPPTHDFWWVPWRRQPSGSIFQSTVLGMVSAEYSENRVEFAMVDNGKGGTNICAGWQMANYTVGGTTSPVNVTGAIGTAFCFHPLFIKE